MIGQLRGRLADKRPNQVMVDVGGVGYLVAVPLSTFAALGELHTEVTLLIHTHVREDALSLYGFLSSREKHFFELLLGASGVGPSLALKILSGFEAQQRAVMDAQTFAGLVNEFEPRFGRLLMSNWRLPDDVQDAASDWRDYRNSTHSDLAGTVHAAHLLATHTLHPQLSDEAMVIESPVFEQLAVFPDDRRLLLTKLDHVRSLAGM